MKIEFEMSKLGNLTYFPRHRDCKKKLKLIVGFNKDLMPLKIRSRLPLHDNECLCKILNLLTTCSGAHEHVAHEIHWHLCLICLLDND